MVILDAYMKNFGNCEEQYFDFSEGLTLFSGNNGEGKSTILRCLTLLCFNQTTGKLSDYVQWGKEDEGFSIWTNVQHLNKNLKISFDYSEKSSNRVVLDLDTSESYKNNAALTYLDELFDTKRALASIVSFENEIDLISTSPAERREYLKRIYDLNFKTELTAIQAEKTAAESNILELESEINALSSITFERISLEKPPFNESLYLEKKENKLNLIEIKSNLLRQLAEEEKNKEKLENTEFEIFKVKKKITSQDFLIKSQKEEKIETELKLSNLKLNISGIEEEKKKEKETIEEELKELKKQKLDLETKIKKAIEPELDESSLQINDLENEVYEYNSKIKQISENTEIFKTGVCPTCGHKVDDSYLINSDNELKKYKDLKEKTTIKLEENKNIKQDYLDQKQKYINKVKEFTNSLFSITSSIQMIEKDLAHLEERYESKIEMEKTNFNHRKSSLTSKIQELINMIKTSIETKDLHEDKLIELSEAIEKIEKSLSESNDISLKLKEKAALIDSLEKEISQYETIIISNEEKRKFNLIQEEKEKERDLSLLTIKDELVKAQEMVSLTTLSNKILSREFPSFVISRMISSLTFYLNEFLSKVYPNYTIEIVESKSSLRVLYGPRKTDVKLASGFEQQVFSFAWKYALGKIQNYNLLILDEVDSAASEENSEKFYSTLAKMEDCFKQIFVVTHKQDIKDMLSSDYGATVFHVAKGKYQKIN